MVMLCSMLLLGAHTLSGAVLDPKALNELLPDWKERGVCDEDSAILIIITAILLGSSSHSRGN